MGVEYTWDGQAMDAPLWGYFNVSMDLVAEQVDASAKFHFSVPGV